jgi:GNAT superfamily N-acetyltransferase
MSVRPGDAPFVIRQATTADLAVVAPLFDAYRQFYGCAADHARAHEFLADRQRLGESVLLVALRMDSAGDAIGFTQLYPSFSSVSMSRVVILNDLFVAPAWRRSTVARRLVGAAVAHAAERGAIRLELATQCANAPARRLYESLGFVPDTEYLHMSRGLASGRG